MSHRPSPPANDRAAFARLRAELCKVHSGKHALFRLGQLVDVFDTLDSAYLAGLERFGLTEIFIAEITPEHRDHLPDGAELDRLRAGAREAAARMGAHIDEVEGELLRLQAGRST